MNVGYKTEEEIQKDETLTVLEDRSIDSNKYVVWHIEGGLGKNIAAIRLNEDEVGIFSWGDTAFLLQTENICCVSRH